MPSMPLHAHGEEDGLCTIMNLLSAPQASNALACIQFGKGRGRIGTVLSGLFFPTFYSY